MMSLNTIDPDLGFDFGYYSYSGVTFTTFSQKRTKKCVNSIIFYIKLTASR